jgi:tight adherence protein B
MDSTSLTVLISVMVAVAIAGLGYALLGRRIESHDRTSKRVGSVAQPAKDRQSRKNPADPLAQRRRAVQDSLKDAERKQNKRAKIPLRSRLEGAGLKLTPRGFYLLSLALGAGLAVAAMFGTKNTLVAGLALLVGLFGLPSWILSFLRARRQKAFTREFANALEIIVRGVKSGLPVNECLRIIANESPPPLGPEFFELVESQRMGVPLDQALQKLYERMPIAELNFFSIVLAIQQKTGGNLSEALGNLARVLRERKKLRMKIQAMSSEAKASAMIIGALPLVVMGGMAATSPDYIGVLFHERLGNVLLILAVVWMGMGVAAMAKMINFKI